MVRQILQHPLRSMGAALTAVGAAVVFVVLILPALAGAGNPSGQTQITGYENQKGKTTQKVSQGKWFYVVGKNFGANVGQITDVYCWENRALSDEGIAPHFTAVSSWDYVSGTSKLITVDVNNDCAGSHGPNTIAIQFYGPDQAPGEDIYTDDPGDGGDDFVIVGPPLAIG